MISCISIPPCGDSYVPTISDTEFLKTGRGGGGKCGHQRGGGGGDANFFIPSFLSTLLFLHSPPLPPYNTFLFVYLPPLSSSFLRECREEAKPSLPSIFSSAKTYRLFIVRRNLRHTHVTHCPSAANSAVGTVSLHALSSLCVEGRGPAYI